MENARGLGCHLAQWLVERGETVLDASTVATARVRELSRGGRRKNDVIDASAAASVAALQGDAAPVVVDDDTVVFALLEERRASLTAQRVRSVNQLHALLRDLVAGGAPTALTAVGAAALLRKIRPATAVQRTRKQLAWDLVREIRSFDAALESITERMIEALEAHPSRLVDIDGVGPVLAARLIGRCGAPQGSQPRTRSPATPAPPRWRPPAANGSGIGSHAAATANSTRRCTSWR